MTRGSDVPYLPKTRIEKAALALLGEYGEKHGVIAAPPVPIDEILELHLGLTIELKNLRDLFSHGDVHGALWMREQVVGVDDSLDPALHPSKTGRYRFTLAHEAGHWRLHKAYYLEDPNQGKLFGPGLGQPTYVCRSSEAKKPVEWQADYFAACVLMPRELVVDSWHRWRGSLDAVCINDLRENGGSFPSGQTVPPDVAGSEDAVFEKFCRPLAGKFEVSAQALRIRLEELELLSRTSGETLF
jgi:hypothetical protein